MNAEGLNGAIGYDEWMPKGLKNGLACVADADEGSIREKDPRECTGSLITNEGRECVPATRERRIRVLDQVKNTACVADANWSVSPCKKNSCVE